MERQPMTDKTTTDELWELIGRPFFRALSAVIVLLSAAGALFGKMPPEQAIYLTIFAIWLKL